MSEVVQWHRQELQGCKEELKDSQAKLDALVDDLALTTTSACTLSEQKQQAEASLNVISFQATYCNSSITPLGQAQDILTVTCALQACREYIAYLQEAAEQGENQEEPYQFVHEHMLMEYQGQIDHLKAASEVGICGALDKRIWQDCFPYVTITL